MKKMANGTITFDREVLPVLAGFRGRTSPPQVGVGDGGRIQLSKLASEPLVECKWVTFHWDADTRKLTIEGLTGIPKGKKESNFWPCQVGKKNKSIVIAGAQPLTAIAYNYKEAGHQNFEAIVDKKAKTVTFAVPATTPARKPPVTRKKKTATVPAPVPVNGDATAASVAS